MSRTTQKIIRWALGASEPSTAGRLRLSRGFRDRDTREMYVGLGLLAISYLRRTQARRELLYRQEVPEGTALVIHHTSKGQPRLEIVKPGKRRR